jgi:hypothetical protein
MRYKQPMLLYMTDSTAVTASWLTGLPLTSRLFRSQVLLAGALRWQLHTSRSTCMAAKESKVFTHHISSFQPAMLGNQLQAKQTHCVTSVHMQQQLQCNTTQHFHCRSSASHGQRAVLHFQRIETIDEAPRNCTSA